jgi:two-component system, chemotaxis family, CheB/CheR fusion protein
MGKSVTKKTKKAPGPVAPRHAPRAKTSASARSAGKPARAASTAKAAQARPTAQAAAHAARDVYARQPAPGPCIVGIGASAGGFEPIKNLLSIMAPGGGLAFVVIQHLDPTQKSLSTELFAKRTEMAVAEVEEGMRVQPDHVYTVPAGKDVTIRGGVLHVAAPERARGQRMPIDHFFQSLGEDQQQRAIGVVLSGTGADGAFGLKSIVANGGIVLVQRPDTAQFEGMPQAALATGLVTHELAVEDMPVVLTSYARHPYTARPEEPVPTAEGHEPLLRAILGLVHAKRGYDFAGYKRATLLRRIHRRMGLNHIENMSDYAARLKTQPREIDALFKDLLIGATEFFRDADAWHAFEADVVAPLVAAKRNDDPIRVWVAGASTGEEAYSVAMLFLEALDRANKHCPLQIFATDTSEDAMAAARMGIYPVGISSRISTARLRRFFNEADDGRHYQVTSDLRAVVVFGVQNLFSDPPFSGVDLVTCRNVLIYLEPDVQKRVVLTLHFALKPDGFLFLGSAETLGPRDDLFKPVSKASRIYRRVGTTPREQLDFRVNQVGQRAVPAGFQLRPSVPQLTQAARLAQRITFDRFAPASVLVDPELNALYFCGPTDRFLLQPRGAPTHHLLLLLRESLRSRLLAAMTEAENTNATVVVKDAQVKRGGVYEPVRLTVIPTTGEEGRRLFLVVFEDEQRPPAMRRGIAVESTLVRQLEEELYATREDLRATVEGLQSSNEELKTANEEVVSINEELQSSNEELQSSKEELQSLNEELNTVNQQLQTKVGELETSNNDLKNVLASNEVATLCLDRDLRVKWFSPAARGVLGLIAGDIGRPIGMFGTAPLGEVMISEARTVLDRQAPIQSEVQGEKERWYLRRTLPYLAEDNQIDGVIVTFTDITDSRRNVEERARNLRRFAFELTRAEEMERQAIARDLHDDLGQLLLLFKLKLAKLKPGSDQADVLRTVAELGELAVRAERSVRSLAVQLSPPVLYELGLIPALEWLAEQMITDYGLSIELIGDDAAKRLGQAPRGILFRAIRELLINIARHAGVTSARVATRPVDDALVVTVSDAGVGFDPDKIATEKKPSFGLDSVRERLAYVGGSMRIASKPGRGTEVTLTVPLQAQQQATDEIPPRGGARDP